MIATWLSIQPILLGPQWLPHIRAPPQTREQEHSTVEPDTAGTA